ncbi:uncharacterized protein FIBRA_08537 [Fibroporia radiculosa]|uniref:Uncharacterized protein n=1 Tax=Fibroporia radiculosa TaxID=599839 RepID=J4ICE8_9APHY|nr:uncharacterized protein FIBRA_08537 [Fibroporia radiculosa]CCM06286.1 predicted protein [Fibroporia radiculosa]
MATKRTHKVFQQGKRHWELIPAVSRSGGLDKEGDTLKDFKVQEEYYRFICTKVAFYWKEYPCPSADGDVKRKQESQANILILFRKLREGLQSTNRTDAFALDVYENSLHLSILFHSTNQATSILSHLLQRSFALSSQSSTLRAQRITVLSLLHNILVGYPSQSRYYEQLYSLPRHILPRDSCASQWLHKLTRSLRTRDYAVLQDLTSCEAFKGIFPDTVDGAQPVTTLPGAPTNLSLEAACTLVDEIRNKARETTWTILRSAYRELQCLPNTEARHDKDIDSLTSNWLLRSLALRPITSSMDDVDSYALIEEWLVRRCTQGEVRRKEGHGMEDKWIICKAPAKGGS